MMPRKRTPGKKPRPQKNTLVISVIAVAAATIIGFFIFGSMRSSLKRDVIGTPPANGAGEADVRAKKLSYEVVNSYPHDPTSFTQGLLWHAGGFYESTGLYGQSKLRQLEFPSGRVLKEVKLTPELFGEGLALVDSRLIQLTWQSQRGFVYDLNTFKVQQEFRYSTEGWGLTYDGTNLILSDGSSDLFYFNPETFNPIRKIAVKMNGQPITELNELEFIEGEIWSNVWQQDLILQIDPATGMVRSFLDLKGILAPSDKSGGENVLNGIAYDGDQKRIFITGKQWPRIFEIKIKR
jgi:glutaminyl-peptide cyclotransferase